ncbi:MAG: RHS repeat-associated core domain-containing protein, partial [Candidatus Nanopelagicales bacterium]|nr:RHS repeat-associated core domain-containing protein [Candidatus Nanopelagicales bacterium]
LSSLVYTTAASGDRSLGAGNGLVAGYAQTTDGLGRARVLDTTTTGAMLADGDLPGSRAVAEYDHAGRLTGASMWLGSTCLSEEFGYGVESTRPTTTTGTTRSVDWKADPVKDCPTPAKTYTTSRVFNSMAQITSGTTPTVSGSGKVTGSSQFTYGYDSLGRVTALPGEEVPVGGAVTQTYYVDDSVASSISFDTGSDTWLVRQYGMDPLGRQNTVTETTVTKANARTAKQALAQARKANDSAVTTRHFGDGSDSPTWQADSAGTTTQWLPGLDEGVAAVITTSGDTSTGVVPVVSPHGDNANTLPLVDDQASTRVGAGDGAIDGLDLDVWELYDAYGHPINNTVSVSGVANTLGATGSAASTDASGGDRYGWLGDYQRPTAEDTGLIQMGARPYNPVSGQFLSKDPIRGGNQNPYTYPVDPVNELDVAGLGNRNSGMCRDNSRRWNRRHGCWREKWNTEGRSISKSGWYWGKINYGNMWDGIYAGMAIWVVNTTASFAGAIDVSVDVSQGGISVTQTRIIGSGDRHKFRITDASVPGSTAPFVIDITAKTAVPVAPEFTVTVMVLRRRWKRSVRCKRPRYRERHYGSC